MASFGPNTTPKSGSSSSAPAAGHGSSSGHKATPHSVSETSASGGSADDGELQDSSPSMYSPRPQSILSARSARSALSQRFALVGGAEEMGVVWLSQRQQSHQWISDMPSELEGALMRKSPASYAASPRTLLDTPFGHACVALNVACAITVKSPIVQTFFEAIDDMLEVPLQNGLRLQILATMEDLHHARKHQNAAFIAADGILVVWDEDRVALEQRALRIESELVQMVFDAAKLNDDDDEKKVPAEMVVEIDEESGRAKLETRPVHLQNAILVAITLILVIVALGAAWRQIAIEFSVDGSYMRFALLALFPVQVFFTLFFAQVIVGCLAQIFGPNAQLKGNSKFFSAKRPLQLPGPVYPHVTIQCPVYKEGLENVIKPTVMSIKAAMSVYEMQGGSANMFINDDGLQLLSEKERSKRIKFYADHGVGWVARPKHQKGGFQRAGKFKKASNMNFALMISCKVEDKLQAYDRSARWNQYDEAQAYEEALNEVLEEDGRAWADGNIRVGDYILLVDSDTRVPEDCFLDAVSEMEQSPEVGIMQFSSGVMQVVHTYFENGITFFTNLIYSAIRYTVANGDVAPFVGHNAFLRWSAVQEVKTCLDSDEYDKLWSESHVSEDFDMSLRLQCSGYTIRLAAWANDKFLEGVSLTVYDELNRWEKYAYGCNELLFNPIYTWLWKSPFTPLFRRFLFSSIRFTSKVTIIAYIGTYYAIGAAWVLTSANYFLVGWYNGYLDKYYIDSWKVWFSIIIVFNGLGNIALAIMRYRIGERGLLMSLFENFKWTIMLAIFLGGLSLHVSQALLSHMFGFDMQWGATSKEAEKSNFFIEAPKVFKKFKWSMLFASTFIAGMIILAEAPFIPHDWRIKDFVAILPMATVSASHLLLPVVLNPALMVFSF